MFFTTKMFSLTSKCCHFSRKSLMKNRDIYRTRKYIPLYEYLIRQALPLVIFLRNQHHQVHYFSHHQQFYTANTHAGAEPLVNRTMTELMVLCVYLGIGNYVLLMNQIKHGILTTNTGGVSLLNLCPSPPWLRACT
jgi:hypothetical protein